MRTKLYKLIPTDITQYSEDELLKFLNELKISLGQLESKKGEGEITSLFSFSTQKADDYFFKVYCLDENLFLETNYQDELVFPEITLQEMENSKFLNKFIIDDEFANSDAFLGDDYVKINGIYLRLINLYEFSKRLSVSSLMDYGDYCLFFRKIDSPIARKQVNTQRKMHHANLYSMMRNIESEASFKEAESLTEAMMEGLEEIFEVEGWFLLKADDLERLNEKTKKLLRALRQAEITPFIESEGLALLFLTLLSEGKPLFKRSHRPQSSYLVNMLPLIQEKIHEDGISFFSNRGNYLKFNVFDESALNFNLLLTGQTGAGKSMVAQKILVEEIHKGTSVIVLDLGNSFKKTAAYYGGDILSLSFNPLMFRCPHYLKELIVSVIPENELSEKIKGKIFSLVEIHLENVTSFKELILCISAQIPELDLYFAELWEFFDTEERSLSSFTYVDTSIYPDKIKAPLIIFLIEAFKRIEGRKLFFFDEVWDFLRNNGSYLEECFRTFRKHGGGAIAISQGIGDFEQTPIGSIIGKLCSTKIFLQQNLDGLNQLDSFDLGKIKSLSTKRKQYSEFYIKTEFHRKIARYYPTPLEYELGTTSDLDRKSFENFYQQNEAYFEFPEIMDRFVNFKYYFGGIRG